MNFQIRSLKGNKKPRIVHVDKLKIFNLREADNEAVLLQDDLNAVDSLVVSHKRPGSNEDTTPVFSDTNPISDDTIPLSQFPAIDLSSLSLPRTSLITVPENDPALPVSAKRVRRKPDRLIENLLILPSCSPQKDNRLAARWTIVRDQNLETSLNATANGSCHPQTSVKIWAWALIFLTV